jgi:hypothetical protein
MYEYKKENIVQQSICKSETGQSSITQYSNGDIIFRVSKFEKEGVGHDGELKELEQRVRNLEGAITTLEQTISSLIDQKVGKHEIVNAINISSEGIRIKGDKIQIDRNTLRDL